jgi:hypothetical protein
MVIAGLILSRQPSATKKKVKDKAEKVGGVICEILARLILNLPYILSWVGIAIGVYVNNPLIVIGVVAAMWIYEKWREKQ